MDEYRVRSAGPTDLRAIDWLQRTILPMDVPSSTKLGWWWVAHDTARRPVAFAASVQSARWVDAIYLCRSGVLVRARGNGLQHRLIKVREQHAKRIGMRWLITDTNQNPASANSLIRAGFRMYLPAHPWADTTACYWRKRIA